MPTQSLLYLFMIPLRAFLFVAVVWGFRDLARSFLFPHMLLAKGTAGNRLPGIAIFSKWFVSLTRIEFYARRDWPWVIILSLCTLQIGLLPLGSSGPLQGENSSMAILSIFALTVSLINLTWWSIAPIVGTAQFLRVTNRTLLSVTVLILIFGYLGLIGMSDIEKAVTTSAISLNPVAILGFICAIAMIQLITVEAPTRTEGWGAHHLARNFIQVFWYALVVVAFTGVATADPVLGFLELVIKTGLLMVVCDALRMFVPEPRGALVDRVTLYLIIPFALVMVLSLVYQGLR